MKNKIYNYRYGLFDVYTSINPNRPCYVRIDGDLFELPRTHNCNLFTKEGRMKLIDEINDGKFKKLEMPYVYTFYGYRKTTFNANAF